MSDVLGAPSIRRVHDVIASPLGPLTVAGTDSGALSGIFFEGHSHPPKDTLLGERSIKAFEHARVQLDEYFAGSRRVFDLALDPVGEPFQLRVWAALAQIPWCEIRSYGDIALQLGGPHLARAVGAANGRNPLSIIVPCHRVVGASGRLTGYAGGLERKRHLLLLEQDDIVRPDRLF